ncbi:MAG TPA: hypothetical protein VLA12_06705, partial [Planctomycetaceae bacterium]|nr:hypothetical protein [Planctomycetaceae bacterium]
MLTTFSQTIRVSRVLCGFGLLCGLLLATPRGADAQQRYYPLDQATPPGVYGAWSGWQQHRQMPQLLQAVRVILPEEGSVIFYSSA